MWRDDWNEQKFFWIYRGQNKSACFMHAEKGFAISNATNILVTLCTFTSFIDPESLPIWRKVILLLETSDGILGKINTMICKVGLMSPDPQNLWLAWEHIEAQLGSLNSQFLELLFTFSWEKVQARYLPNCKFSQETIAAVYLRMFWKTPSIYICHLSC